MSLSNLKLHRNQNRAHTRHRLAAQSCSCAVPVFRTAVFPKTCIPSVPYTWIFLCRTAFILNELMDFGSSAYVHRVFRSEDHHHPGPLSQPETERRRREGPAVPSGGPRRVRPAAEPDHTAAAGALCHEVAQDHPREHVARAEHGASKRHGHELRRRSTLDVRHEVEPTGRQNSHVGNMTESW